VAVEAAGVLMAVAAVAEAVEAETISA
jgi:hypothetical protein